MHRFSNWLLGTYFSADEGGGGGGGTDPATDPGTDPNPDPAADAATDPNADPKGDGGDQAADRNRRGYELRQTQKRVEEQQKVIDGYKRREEDARKAKLTEEQRMKEELDELRAERDRLSRERLQNQVAAEFKLPASLAVRLVGTDLESLRADAEELAKLLPKPKAGTTTTPAKEPGGATATFKRSQLRDPAFFRAHEAEILAAHREGRIVND